MNVTSLRHRALAVVAGTGLALSGTLIASPPPASASLCEGRVWYTVKGTSTRMPFKNVPMFKDGRGGTITVSRTYSGSVAYSVTAGAESEVGAVLAKAKVSISASLTKTNSTSTTHTYSHKISQGMFGNVKYVSWGKKVRWKKKIERRDCSIGVLREGVIRFPSQKEGWYYWETKS